MNRHSIGWLLLLCTLTSACAVREDIKGSDSGVLLPTLRLYAPLLDSGEGGTQEEGTDEPPAARGIFGIEGSGDFATGSFDQDGNGIPTDYRLWQATGAARGGVVIRDRLRIEGIGGLGWNSMKLDFTRFGVPQRVEEDGIGIMVGGQLSYEPFERVTIYGRLTAQGTFVKSTSVITEVGVSVKIIDELRVIAGYRSWRYRLEHELAASSQDVDVKIDGFLIGGELRF